LYPKKYKINICNITPDTVIESIENRFLKQQKNLRSWMATF
jgi:hypothetical protein